jgi:predicted helicase
MAISMDAFKTYIDSLRKNLATHDASEGSHYSSLKALIEASGKNISAQVLPQHIKEGAPDVKVSHGITITIGYIEAKDIGSNLDAAEKSKQINRYLALPNLILTDFLEFRWYVDGKLMHKSRLGILRDRKIQLDADGAHNTASMLDGFLEHHVKSANTPKELARHMARLAHFIREEIINSLMAIPPSSSLLSQLAAFRESLIPDLDEAKFADMYAQTITYGLFAGRCSESSSIAFSRLQASDLIPKTNPFLRKTFQHIAIDLDERVAFWVDELVELLRYSDMETILKDFGKRIAKDDPVVDFYETFLAAYDPKLRKLRGVYYTPAPIVSYIVRSVDYVLKKHFNKPQGFADNSVLILDPAVGTATFLYMVLREIFGAQKEAGQLGYWDSYVSQYLLKRIFGFELLMAPYTVAHLKLGLLLKETGYKFQTDERLGVYLTNTLEEAFKKSEQLAGFNKYIVDEANSAAEIKKDKPIMVILGNPPYSVSSLNRGEWIDTLLDDYKQGLYEKKLNIDDDYIKFIRFAQWRIDKTGYGILGFITNNSYLDGLTHRRMREYLLENFSNIYILNLHGSSRRSEQSPGNIKDENVFDIQQGVAVGIFIKETENTGKAHVYYSDIWGSRERKNAALSELSIDIIKWQKLVLTAPYFFFVPKDFSLENEYSQGWSIDKIFLVSQSGLQTDRDNLFLDSDREALDERIRIFFNKGYGDDFKERYRIYSSSSYDIELRRDRTAFVKENIQRCLYRPFDSCYLYYDPILTSRPAYEVMQHMIAGKNLALVTVRQVAEESFNHTFVSRSIVERRVTLSSWGAASVFPLYLYPTKAKDKPDKSGGREGGVQTVMQAQTKREPNLNTQFIKSVAEKLGLEFVSDGKGDLKETFGPEAIFNYAYAVFHSPTYRNRYAEFLKIGFPKLPLTSDKTLFKALMGKGTQLVALHLMESPILEAKYKKVSYPVKGSHLVEKVSYDAKAMRVNINKEQYFLGVQPEVWDFYIGGYQVCEKWLKGRKGRQLSPNDINHFQKIVIALEETIRLMAEIDALIHEWPLK